MSNLDEERLSHKLQTLLNYSLELKCHNIINWNLYINQTNVLESFFNEKFKKEETSQHEITKNIFKDFILRSNSTFPKEIWKKELETSVIGKKYQEEINRQFITKELILKTSKREKQSSDKENENKKSYDMNVNNSFLIEQNKCLSEEYENNNDNKNNTLKICENEKLLNEYKNEQYIEQSHILSLSNFQ